MRRTSLALFVLSWSAIDAAAWSALVEGPDVFGATKVLVTEGTGSDGIVIQCDSKGNFAFAYIFRKKEFDEVAEAAAVLYVQTAKEKPPTKLAATLRSWNANYAGVVVSDGEPEVLGVVRAIGQATGRIGIGYEIGDMQASADFSSRGSTSAIGKLLKGCNLEQQGLPPA